MYFISRKTEFFRNHNFHYKCTLFKLKLEIFSFVHSVKIDLMCQTSLICVPSLKMSLSQLSAS